MDGYKPKFGIKLEKNGCRTSWALGVCLSRFIDEKYLLINLFYYDIMIGKICK